MSVSISDKKGDAGRNRVRFLRIISVWTFIPSFAFNLAHGVTFGDVLPAIGLLPHAFSVGLAIYELGWLDRLFRKHHYRIVLQDEPDVDEPEGDNPSSLRTLIVAVLDLVFGGALLGCIVGAYIMMDSHYNWWHRSNAALIVGTYATLPYTVNALIHGFFFLKAIWEASKRCTTPKKPPTCPHCHSSLSRQPSASQRSASQPSASRPSASQPVTETVTETV